VRAAADIRHSITRLNADLIKEPRGVGSEFLRLPFEAIFLALAVSQQILI
jgi:hypothetical protein